MIREEFGDFAKRLGTLGAIMGEALTAERIAGYFDMLGDMPAPVVAKAIALAAKTLTFFPKPGELRALCGDGSPDVGLVEALFVDHLGQIGSWRKPPTDPFLKLVCDRLGGYRMVQDYDAGQRIFALGRVLPGAVQAAQEQGLRLPCEAVDGVRLGETSRTMAQRSLTAATEPRAVPYDAPGGVQEVPTTRVGRSATVGDLVAARFRKLGGGS